MKDKTIKNKIKNFWNKYKLYVAYMSLLALMFIIGFAIAFLTFYPYLNNSKNKHDVLEYTMGRKSITELLLHNKRILQQEPEWQEFTATAYCPCYECCGKWALNRPNGIVYTASGEIAVEGVTVAADWNVLPAGTVIEIKDMGIYTVHDKPADWVSERYGGKVVDIYFNNHESIKTIGKKQVLIKVLKWGEK